ncbi:hypothetical protein RD792_003874 [Penstemon davidsonii]|uniref:Response regulatory domain-containing protein n=1 Tax=Penstemon davidsonii TaxID=160366 RepID=A0ABR0DG09_9LAMI|nr:hypothetical protein RD792_003874 [Penstemon davidsonii]
MVGNSTKKIRALVVDDDRLVRRIHGMLLTRFGMETNAVENGKEAVDLFASGKCYDLVFMDMDMPIMDGPKATQMLREMGVSSTIVGVTSRSLETETQAFMEAGLDACWEKPLTRAGIISLLDQVAKKLL